MHQFLLFLLLGDGALNLFLQVHVEVVRDFDLHLFAHTLFHEVSECFRLRECTIVLDLLFDR